MYDIDPLAVINSQYMYVVILILERALMWQIHNINLLAYILVAILAPAILFRHIQAGILLCLFASLASFGRVIKIFLILI